ncbi:hypothetical protein Vau01_101560 [Virgisporangium aurantiacum]|uniref:Uncharacterized protein n=2 Tax=Virgisporangium aurantiacum TaxID=175570 RepID=A0A8J3ZIM1_9ACTN|nr:hypothetical protein Vau01_101560 [Virgisporangium aurantiacum]
MGAMALPYVRTYNEAILYIRLRPCGCGETEVRWQDVALTLDGEPARYFTGACENCGRPREFTLAMPEQAQPRNDVVFGEGATRSEVLDPGEWLSVSDLYGQRAEEVLSDGEFGAEDVSVVHYTLSARVSAVDEVLKFLPDNADVVPEWFFRSVPGRAAFEAAPGRFGRDALLAERTALWENLERFVKDYYGDGTGPTDSDAG